MDRRVKVRWNVVLTVLLVLTLGFIWGNSLLDREESAQVSNGFLDRLAPLFEEFGLETEDDHWLRKLAHFAEFSALGCELTLLFYLNAGVHRRSFLMACGAALLAAVCDETIQYFTGRSAQFGDVLLDLSGAVAAALLITGIRQIANRRKKGKSKV